MMNQVRCLLIGACLATGLAFNAWAADNGTEPELCNNGAGSGYMYSRTELFFGLSKPSRPYVNDHQFKDFVDTEVTPRFPDGLTLLSGIGQYLDGSNIVQEKSRVLILLYPPSADSSLAVDQIRDAYVRRFDQMGVLRVDGQSCVTF